VQRSRPFSIAKILMLGVMVNSLFILICEKKTHAHALNKKAALKKRRLRLIIFFLLQE
jgi:hypothetical protein